MLGGKGELWVDLNSSKVNQVRDPFAWFFVSSRDGSVANISCTILVFKFFNTSIFKFFNTSTLTRFLLVTEDLLLFQFYSCCHLPVNVLPLALQWFYSSLGSYLTSAELNANHCAWQVPEAISGTCSHTAKVTFTYFDLHHMSPSHDRRGD